MYIYIVFRKINLEYWIIYVYVFQVYFLLCVGINLEYLKYLGNEILYQLVDMVKFVDM